MILTLQPQSLKRSLRDFFHNLKAPRPTPSAFCQARKKLKYAVFAELNNVFTGDFYQSKYVKKWKNYRLLAVDGSIIRVPNKPHNKEYFGSLRKFQEDNNPSARASLLYDVCNDIVLEGTIAPTSKGEIPMAMDHLKHVKKGDLILFDRGYSSYVLMNSIISRDADFCFRIPVKTWNFAQELVDSNEDDRIVFIKAGRDTKTKEQCQEYSLDMDILVLRAVKIKLPDGYLGGSTDHLKGP